MTTDTDTGSVSTASLRAVHTDAAPAAVGAYSQAVCAGDLVFVSGQLPIDPATGEFAGPGVREEAAQSLRNGAAVLEAAGSGIGHVVKTTVLLADIADFAVVNEVYAEVFSGGVLPARAAYQVGALPKGARVEIEFVGVVAR
ncbi:Rid family detoxifying hydrolase [Frigoribacterium faeni]|uniref:Rid family detoxifying hydrolase n=1 Tax=Frigoribacterium faeni TaxID=145483 RepID=UPI00141B059E|nr:Rid family detoxifying hydrolase [Frigoribacterium faeni]NIJ06411.1 2-iminobutanoate/2-iminopropanoate deaminase [Frigoribacterium faeni]